MVILLNKALRVLRPWSQSEYRVKTELLFNVLPELI